VIRRERPRIEPVERGQTGPWPFRHPDRRGAIQLDDRRRRDLGQSPVERDDPPPVGRGPRESTRMTRGNRRLNLVRARLLDCAQALEAREAARDARAVPPAAILIGQQHEVAVPKRALISAS
jgi:hypothetical protein